VENGILHRFWRSFPQNCEHCANQRGGEKKNFGESINEKFAKIIEMCRNICYNCMVEIF
jgi:hypothetical protein